MFRRIDQSAFLIRLLGRISNLLARQRGLPIVIGIFMVLIGLIVQVSAALLESRPLEVLGVLTNNLGVLIALLGVLLATPLGR